MVESRRFPGSGRMAGIAAGSKTSIVLVVYLVAGVTCSRCALEYASLMALLTVNGEVSAG